MLHICTCFISEISLLSILHVCTVCIQTKYRVYMVFLLNHNITVLAIPYNPYIICTTLNYALLHLCVRTKRLGTILCYHIHFGYDSINRLIRNSVEAICVLALKSVFEASYPVRTSLDSDPRHFSTRLVLGKQTKIPTSISFP